jgi:hypothetical protein
VLAANVNLALEDKDHMLGCGAFLVKHVAWIGGHFLAVSRQPQTILKGQAVQGANVIEGFGDLFDWCRSNRRDDREGKHRGTSMADPDKKG